MEIHSLDTRPEAWSTPLSNLYDSFTAEFYYGFESLVWTDIETFISLDAIRSTNVPPKERLRSFVLSAFPRGIAMGVVLVNYDFLADDLDLDLTRSNELGISGTIMHFDHRPGNRLKLFHAFLALLSDIRDHNGNDLLELSAFLLSQCATRTLSWRYPIPWIQEDHLVLLLDEAFLTVAKKMVTRYSVASMLSMHDILYADVRRRIKIGGILWPLSLTQPRSTQYIREHIRKRALRMVILKVCSPRLPWELVDMVYSTTLNIHGLLPDDRRIMAFTWTPFDLLQLSVERKPLGERDRICCRARSPRYRLQTSQDAFVWSSSEHAYIKYHATVAYVVRSNNMHTPSVPRPETCDVYYFRCGDTRFQDTLGTNGRHMGLYRMGRMNFLVPAKQGSRLGHEIAEEA